VQNKIDGATTLYLSTRQNINLNILYEYILNRIYNFDFLYKPNLSDRDSYFVPCGYDSLPVLRGFDTNDDLSKFYEERIPPFKNKGAVGLLLNYKFIIFRLKRKKLYVRIYKRS
jgi:hypothetical protein